MTTDYTGAPLSVGARVEAWLDRNRYEGTLTEIKPLDGSGYRWVTVRSDDGDLHETFSDAVRVLRAKTTETETTGEQP